MADYKIALIPGDGIGPELTETTLKVLNAAKKKFNFGIKIIEVEAGDDCLRRRNVALPEDTIEKIKNSHACLKGPVGETAADVIVRLRLMFDLYANIRPIKAYPSSQAARPDIDLVFARENTEDVYKGLEFALNKETTICLRVITRRNSERIARKAFDLALKRNNKRRVTAVHKANVMKITCGLFASVCREIASKYPNVKFDEQYVDAASMRLIKAPQEFDVIVTTNMFGDILSDEAAQLIGGLGMAPGANIGDNFAIFEPVHGSAPNRVGKHTANPCSMILAFKMMLEWLGEQHGDPKCSAIANAVENAVIRTLQKGTKVPDLGGKATTEEMGDAIAEEIARFEK
jgi:3-isopropylmalate dehydrogenase